MSLHAGGQEMTDTDPNKPYWTLRSVTEEVLRSQGLVPGQVFHHSVRGQNWQIPQGPTFAIQWFGDKDEYVDQGQVSYVLEGIAEWRARTRNLPSRVFFSLRNAHRLVFARCKWESVSGKTIAARAGA
jgi:hypothetical protein